MRAEKKQLWQYYKTAKFNPVYAGFRTAGELADYDRLRRKIFEHNLRLPVNLFRGADVLEFGPASGENSLVFARWGAKLHLVEPVEEFLIQLKTYFSRFGLQRSLRKVVCCDVESYRDRRKYDIVVAEGFIYTLGSPQRWVPLLLSFVKDGGFVLYNHIDAGSCLIEVLLNKVFQVFLSRTRAEPMALARRFYGKKWDMVPHVRSFESWVGDSLLNPLINRHTLYTLMDQQRAMNRQDFDLWSSWPALYSKDMTWIKKPLEKKRFRHEMRRSFMAIVPSLILGCYVEVLPAMEEHGGALMGRLLGMVRGLDGLTEETSMAQIQTILANHQAIEEIFSKAIRDYDASMIRELWNDIEEVVRAVGTDDLSKAIRVFNRPGPLLTFWGSPNVYCVWHRL
ncbi:MAG: methyltransferase domain-containing protein [Candidatus Omnitrophica bacterium]|nr:methyltransferase domain-containing protein [Candidatus Omnitrophota bacterium]